MARKKVYSPCRTGQSFHADRDSRVKAVMGPVGSGKSVINIMELLRLAEQQAPTADGVRLSRWAILRNSYPQLRTTVLKSFQNWIPKDICPVVYDAPIRGSMQYRCSDGTRVDAEFIFMAADNVEKVESDLLSFELTGGWMNEAGEMHKRVFTALASRLSRYPAKIDAPLTWSGILMDYNPCAYGSWLYDMFEKDRKKGYTLYKQPPALLCAFDEADPDDFSKAIFTANPDAENVQHQQLGYDYWLNIAKDNPDDPNFVRRMVLAEYTLGETGRPVFPGFRHTRHVTKHHRKSKQSTLVVGLDFGLTPAAIFGQYVDGRLVILSELPTYDCDLLSFIEEFLVPHIRERYSGYKVIIVGDPSGGNRSGIDKRTPLGVLQKFGYTAQPAITNSISPRLEAVNWFLRRSDVFQVLEECTITIRALAGGYKWKESRSKLMVKKEPDKNDYSHIMDALQYLCLYYKSGVTDDFYATPGVHYSVPKKALPDNKFLYV